MERKHSEQKAAFEERRHGNPAHLIRQARKSLVAEDDMGKRHRRYSAPVHGEYEQVVSESASSCAGVPLQAKAFKTKSRAVIRSFASAVSQKIGDLPQGWKVAEVSQKEKSEPGWIAIEPRGFVLAEELEPASPLRRGEPLQPEAVHRISRRASMSSSFEMAATEAGTHEAVPSRSTRRAETLSSAAKLTKEPWRYGPCRRTTVPSEAPLPPSRTARRTETPQKKTLSRSASTKAPTAQSPRLVTPSSPSRGPGAVSPSRAPRARTNPGLGQSPLRQSSDVEALWALKEEHVQLRESNVDLREQELEKRRELEDLARAREAIASEVRELERSRQHLQEQHDLEQQELERQQSVIKEKLARCRDAVAFAVGSVDELYAQQEAAPMRMSMSSCGQGHVEENTSIIPEEVSTAKVVALEAGVKVSQMLDGWDEAGQENTDISRISTKKNEEVNYPERTPLRTCNALVSP